MKRKGKCSFCNSQWQENDEGCPICCFKAMAEWEEKTAEEWSKRDSKNALIKDILMQSPPKAKEEDEEERE